MTESLIQSILSPKATVGMVCFLLVFAGITSMRNLKKDSPLAPYVMQILGLTFILPVVILITTIINVDGQAVMGLLGTIVGYIFGTSQAPSAIKSASTGLTPNSAQAATSTTATTQPNETSERGGAGLAS